MTSTISAPANEFGTRGGRRLLRDQVIGRAGAPRLPQQGAPVLARPRLTDLIDQATARRVTVVSGPAGAGKTVACAQWAADSRRSAGQVAWLSVSQADRDPAGLWARIRSALAGTPAVGPAAVGAVAAAAAVGAAASGESATTSWPGRLIAAAEEWTTPLVLVIDDIQQLAGSESQAELDLLVRHGPPALRLILAGRHASGLQIARLRVDGELAEIGADDLACTREETDAYFAMLGIELPPAERDELLARTRGWVTGLRLVALRSGPGTSPAAVARISGDDPVVADYLRDEVLARQPAQRRLFLLRTSVTDTICGSLGDALTDQSGSAAVLDRLVREQVMITMTDQVPGQHADAKNVEFEYHPLLRDLLRSELHRELADEVQGLYRRAARWQAARDQQAEAIRSAAQAGDWDFAARVLAQAGPTLLLPGPAAAIEPSLAAFPAGRYATDAAVAGALAAAGLRTGDVRAAALHLANAAEAVDRCAPAQRRVIAPWLRALQIGSLPEPAGELIEQAADLVGQAEPRAAGAAEYQSLGLLRTALGVHALAGLEITAAADHLRQARRHLSVGGHDQFLARATAWLAVAEALGGDAPAATSLAARASESAEDLATAVADVAITLASLLADDLAAARGPRVPLPPGGQERGLLGGSPADRHALRVLTTLARTRYALCEQDPAAARSILIRHRYQDQRQRQDAQQADPERRAGQLRPDPVLAVVDAEIALREGDPARALLALDRPGALDQPGPDGWLLPRARAVLADGDGQRALAEIEPVLTGPAGRLTLADQVGALITAAVAHRRLGQADQATELLTLALALAEPPGLYRPFLDAGPAVRSALTVLIRPASVAAPFAARVLQRFEIARGRQADQPAQAAIPLTNSELAVLRFLPSHMTNQEIAEALFLSINTVKTHLRSVYRKLGVTTRRQAISRGSQIGLL
ncbi:MAG: LuxR C-terminal-related transcriptional regulator [Streptosporangiaceae bacterium]